MTTNFSFRHITPVLPSLDIEKDIAWHKQYTGFESISHDSMYAVLKRDHLFIHLQWHADTKDDPLLGGSVIKIFVKDIQFIFEEFVNRGTVSKDKLRLNTPWNTNEFGFYDLNNNAIFIVE
ncbi:glyoxalase/bleomycin resistance/extradiol dioxygenase family protein [Flavobacteriaceae bacterium AU392]|nr:glyoxalase/bleomycin resistance/extradiol dioxygenase family protein [Flavobacteriaceae bacterium]RKM82758.1 glyoxalase/bleomycin resistance/extradiol dioxygenase family protein [Flavobacteriaceae bacterium AU392]